MGGGPLAVLGWYSNAPDTPTGYGTQTGQITRRMVQAGHVVHLFANYGQIVGVRDWNGVAVWPQGVTQYSLDVVDKQAEMAGASVIFTLYDVWVLGPEQWAGRRVISWTPVDHFPLVPGVKKWAETHDTIAMSEYGARQFRQAGIEPIATIPHGIEEVFRPTPSDIRTKLNVPDDAFLVTINAANIGSTPPRKAWGGNLEALAKFMRKHDDVYLNLHTDLFRPSGIPLQVIMHAVGMPEDRVRVIDPVLYRGGLISDADLAAVYSASDVLLAVSKGEGFGIPVLEAMGCGTPAIVSDFSAQPEIVGETGWKVPGQLDWDQNQGAFFFTPFTFGIVEALEEAYQQRGQRRDACVAQAEQYRTDHLWETKWLPLLASLEPKAEPVRKGSTNAAKRRARKAAA